MNGVVPRALLNRVAESLRDIDYAPEMVEEGYAYTDFLSANAATLEVALAAFAEEPKSFRSACLAFVPAAGDDPAPIARHRAFGAPLVFGYDPGTGEVRLWGMTAEGDPRWIETIAADELPARIRAARTTWGPAQVFRAKQIGVERGPAQLDIFDAGLIPVLEGEVHEKLNGLLKEVLAEAERAYAGAPGKSRGRRTLAATGSAARPLYRLVFRLLAAKVLADRRHPGFDLADDATDALREVAQVLFPRSIHADVLVNPEVRAAVWQYLRGAPDLRHISAEAFGYVYEHTLVTREARSEYDIHATSPALAEYVARRLPFGHLPQDQRRVFEPFCGHAPFLIAAMGQLKALLPQDMRPAERHAYLTRMLVGMEQDPFACEVAEHSLVFANYPRGNGWSIVQGDAFTAPEFDAQLAVARVVLCNPPFSDFGEVPEGASSTNKAIEAVRRILARAPDLLGLVLPLTFVHGRHYREVRRRLDERYGSVEVLELPDSLFAHADVQTAVVVASSRDEERRARTSVYAGPTDYRAFLARGAATWACRFPAAEPPTGAPADLWRTPLSPVWEELRGLPTVRDVAADIGRGLEYHRAWKHNRDLLTSATAGTTFRPGFGNLDGVRTYEPYVARPDTHLNVDPAEIKYARRTLKPGPKVIVNFDRLSRRDWTMAAVVDAEGQYAFFQHFIGVWPKDGVAPELVAAVLNGPLANAFVAERSLKRYHTVETIGAVPFPRFPRAAAAAVVALVHEYMAARREWLAADPGGAALRASWGEVWALEARCADLQRAIDAAVLAAYDLPPRLERQLLDVFAGQRRPGPAPFTGYFEAGYAPAIPYGVYLSRQRREATVQRVVARGPLLNDPAIAAFTADLALEFDGGPGLDGPDGDDEDAGDPLGPNGALAGPRGGVSPVPGR